MTTSCPGCGGPLAAVDQRCSTCGLLLVGPAAAELWTVDQQLAALHHRRTELLGWLRGAPPAALPVASDPAPPGRPGPRSVQRLLLGLGVLLLVVAGLVFVAVSWQTLGVSGQVAVVSAAALLACSASRLLEARGLRASAEAVAALGSGLVGVGLVAARTLGLGIAGQVDGPTYATVTAGLLALVSAAFGLRSRAHAWSVVAVVAATAAVPLGLDAAHGEQLAAGVAFAVAAGAFWLLHLVPPAWLRIRRASSVAGVACAVACWLVTPVAAWSEHLPTAVGCAAAGLLVSLGIILGCARPGGAARLWREHPTLGLAAALAAAVQVATGTSASSPPVEAAVVVLALTVVVVAVRRPAEPRRTWSGIVGLVAVVAAGLLSVDLLVQLDRVPSEGNGLGRVVRDQTWVAVLVVAGVGLAASVLVALRRRPWRDALAGVTALGLLVGTAVGAATTTPAALVVSLGVLAAAFVVWAWSRRDAVAESVALVAALLAEAAALYAAGYAAPDDATLVAVVLCPTGVLALAYGFRPGRGWLWWVGAALLPIGVWFVLHDHEVTTVEAFTLPLAATCLLAGALTRTRERDLSSWASVGPALVIGLLPSALVSVADEGLRRPLLVLLAGVVLLLVGVWRREQALVVVAGIAVVVVAISQLAPWAIGLPRWMSLGTAGALLLTVGVRYESRRRNVVTAARWLRDLR